MSELLDLIRRIELAQQAIVQVEAALAEDPDVPSLRASLRSLSGLKDDLQGKLDAVASESWVDLVAYRLFSEEERPNLWSLTRTLGDFQSFFTLTFDALKSGPKRVAKATAEAIQMTSFGFGYSFSGSVGVVLTLPSERVLLEESDLDRTMNTVFEMARSTSSDQIAHFAKELGPAPVRKLYQWVEGHVRTGVGADINWKRSQEESDRLFLGIPEMENLKLAIEETSDEVTEIHEHVGILKGASIANRAFHLQTGQDADIQGKMAPGVEHSSDLTLGHRYRARIQKTTRVRYSEEKEEVFYSLLSIRPASGSSSEVLTDHSEETGPDVTELPQLQGGTLDLE